MMRSTLLLLSLLAVVACGGATFSGPDAGDGGGSSSGSASGGSSGSSSGSSSGGTTSSSSGSSSGGTTSSSSGSPVAGCPGSLPTQFAPCSENGLVCEWGTSPDPSCDDSATCNSGSWAIPSAPAGVCAPSAPIVCPSSFASVARMSACTPYGGFCDYPEGRCACSVPEGPAMMNPPSAIWLCQDAGPGCPTPRPRLGTPCSPKEEGMQCDYGSCTVPGGSAEQCTAGVWMPAAVGCPLAAGVGAGSR